jgi:hypothetical protein
MLPLGGLLGQLVVQRGIWVPTQHLLWDQPRKTLIELMFVLCLIVVPLPQGETPFAVQLNNNNNNNMSMLTPRYS